MFFLKYQIEKGNQISLYNKAKITLCQLIRNGKSTVVSKGCAFWAILLLFKYSFTSTNQGQRQKCKMYNLPGRRLTRFTYVKR